MFGIPFNIHEARPRPSIIQPAFPSLPALTGERRAIHSPCSTMSGREDPRLRATFGSLCILDSALPQEYVVGRASDCDFVLGGKYSDMISMFIWPTSYHKLTRREGRKHCKLIWNGAQMSIVDMKSVNGTWVS